MLRSLFFFGLVFNAAALLRQPLRNPANVHKDGETQAEDWGQEYGSKQYAWNKDAAKPGMDQFDKNLARDASSPHDKKHPLPGAPAGSPGAAPEVAAAPSAPMDPSMLEPHGTMHTNGDTQASDATQMNAGEGSSEMMVEGGVQGNDQEETTGFVPGNSFTRVTRFADPVMSMHDDPTSLHLSTSSDSDGLRCWNAASESEVLGAGRQMIASRTPMSSAGGIYRLDLRVVSGTDAETAHLFEVGIAADPAAGVQFKVCGPGAFRPLSEGEATPFYGLVSVLDSLLEGVRMAVEVDFDERIAMVRNIPAVDGVEVAPQPTPLAPWLDVRANHRVLLQRPPGEQEDDLFREHAEHLHELIAEGKLRDDLADTVLGDGGARCVRGAGVPDEPEEYYFYIVVPSGMEVEIY